MLDFGRAAQWCDRIAEFAERYGSRMMLAYCRAEYGAVDLWRGRWGAAEAMLEAAIEDFVALAARRWSAARSPAWPSCAAARAGPGDAARLCERAEGSSSAQLCLARMALDRGDAREAAELAERLLRNVPEHRRLSRAPALELLVRARAAAGDLDSAAAALAELREVEREVGTAPLRACARPRRGARWRPHGASTTARACCWRTPSTPSRAPARRSRRRRRGSRWRTASPRWAAARPRRASRRRRASGCASSAPQRRCRCRS